MLNATQVNTILESIFSVLETKIPNLKKLEITAPEPVKTSGAYGSVIMSALFTGGIDGKLTMTLDWPTGFLLAEAITQSKVEGFNDVTQQALESFFQDSVQGMADRFAGDGAQLEIRMLPTLVDTSVLVAEREGEGAIKIPILIDSGTVNLYLAFR